MASNAVQTEALLEAIRKVVFNAWSGGWGTIVTPGGGLVSVGNVPISYGYQKAVLPAGSDQPAPTSIPNVEIFWEDIEISFGGLVGAMKRPQQLNKFTIIARWPLPDINRKVDLARIDRANEFIAEAQTGPNFAGIAMFPLVTRIGRGDARPDQGFYDLALDFECYTVADHH